ncbi:MAG: beta strand repeat-containing protein, partial [Planctomycetaceae bacterium]
MKIADAGTEGNTVAGNYIGTDVTGTLAIGNTGSGVFVNGAQGTVVGTDGDGIGDAAEGNVISGNGQGVRIYGAALPVRNLATVDQLVAGTIPRTTATGTIAQADLFDAIGGVGGNWTLNHDVPGSGGDDYAIVATGSFDVAAAGTYSFAISGDDGGRLRIDGGDVIVDDALHAFEDRYGTVSLTAGAHTFEWVGFEALGGAAWELAVKAGTDVAGPVTEANGWQVLGGTGAAVALQGSIAVTAYYSLVVNDAPTVVAGNLIGLSADGTIALGNSGNGVWIENGTQGNRIGTDGDGASDALERNVISGNAGQGIWITGTGTEQNVIAGNYIGTDVTGTAPLGNARRGVSIGGGARFNLVGTDGDGIGDVAEGNVISGNGLENVWIAGSGTDDTVIAGNYIGLNAAGTAALTNGFGAGLGVSFGPKRTRIGTNADGVSDELERNVISGNRAEGILLAGIGTEQSVVAGNFIGTDVTGTAAVPNLALGGINIRSGAANNRIGTNGDGVGDAAERNVISGNAGQGVRISNAGTEGNTIAGNFIGTDVSGMLDLGNAIDGVTITDGSTQNTIGGSLPGSANVIAFNDRDGVRIDSLGLSNGVLGNSIYANIGLGINLGTDGVTPNDASDADAG